MAVQKRKKSRSRRNKRRNSKLLFKSSTLSKDQKTGEKHIRHFLTKTGYYKGEQIFKEKKEKKIKTQENDIQ